VPRHEWRRHVAERFTAVRAMLGADQFSAEPAAAFFTTGIDTLNRGARHKRHKIFPPAAASSRVGCELPGAAEKILGRTARTIQILARQEKSVNEKKV